MSTSIAFIDTRVADYQALIDGGDGLQATADAVAGRSDIDAIHVFSHGSSGSVQLGWHLRPPSNLHLA